ncbi:MAG: adenosylcobalamin-dependent ribonucleoside-diphosphate reductase [Oligoflexia bacterium]|nr:adenosylcobalamin-dependent ribonucleoside-diphosphate reductase [Oligoflexia bacterium]
MDETLLTPNALSVLRQRYLWPKGKGQESPSEMFARVARALAPKEITLRNRFLKVMQGLEFLPNSPTLMNAGRKDGQLAACFVLPVEDDLKKILDTFTLAALIHQSGGGTGFSFSALRSRGAPIRSHLGTAAGPVAFMELFNELTQTIKQGGLRRGANMGVLDISHPDIESFIHAKQNTQRLMNFNISVSIPDKFMKAVEANGLWALKDPTSKRPLKKVDARNLFDSICQQAWLTGEPGIIFIDEVNRHNPTPSLGPMSATNPCGEQPLLPYEACNLGSINLNKVITNNEINWNHLAEITETGVLLLNKVIDACHYPDPRIESLCQRNRKIGLGVMGFADICLRLNIRYGSEQSIQLANKVMSFIRHQAQEVSQTLARKEGPFDGFSKSLWKKRGFRPMRNATLTTVAPTGTISLIAGCSSGIEPWYSFAYDRKVTDGPLLTEVHPLLKEVLKRHRNDPDPIVRLLRSKGSLQDSELHSEIKSIFVTAKDIHTLEHVEIQAAFQKHSDSAVSKTINLGSSSSVSEVSSAFKEAHKRRCKGITVYRDGSRPDQVLRLENCEDCALPGPQNPL